MLNDPRSYRGSYSTAFFILGIGRNKSLPFITLNQCSTHKVHRLFDYSSLSSIRSLMWLLSFARPMDISVSFVEKLILTLDESSDWCHLRNFTIWCSLDMEYLELLCNLFLLGAFLTTCFSNPISIINSCRKYDCCSITHLSSVPKCLVWDVFFFVKSHPLLHHW